MRHLSGLIGVLLLVNAHAEFQAENLGSAFVVALRAYEAHDFERAARVLEEVVALEPDCARCVHLLGKSYGRMAEQASWVSALGLAKKTRTALELAVALDPDDVAAIEDLIKFYREAPRFLGGSRQKAEALEQRLRLFESGLTG